MGFLFEKLDVYQLSLSFHNKIINICGNKSFQGYSHLVDHLKRASLSISLNIAEGNGRFHKNDRKNFFLIARGSAFECVPILTICQTNNLIDSTSVQSLREEIERISKMLSGLIN